VLERVGLDRAVGKAVVFVRCRLIDLLAEPLPGPTLSDCLVTLLPPEQFGDEAIRRRDLDDLFPGWRARLGR
jgi:hypothetical protein